MSGKKVFIVGATSAIAEATARRYAARGDALYLLARDAQRVQAIADDLRVRGAASVHTDTFDAADFDAHADVIERAWAALGSIDIVLIAHGTLPEQLRCDANTEYAIREFTVNGTATIAIINAVARRLEIQGIGTLAVISSVAGDRGRASNHLYGAAKAAVSAYTSGLRQRLHQRGVNVLTIKPGFVDTPMTSSFRKGLLWSKPDVVAQGITQAIDRRRGVAYLPWFWFPIMLVIKHIPEPLFRRIKL